MANRMIKIAENIEHHYEDQTAWAPPDEPPGSLGEYNTTTTNPAEHSAYRRRFG